MDAKKLTLLLILLMLFPATQVLAGGTTITGTASCVMPDLFEMKAQSVAVATPAQQAPMAQGASGSYEVKEEERLIQTEENLVTKDATGTENKVRVYSICAK
jgi:hypothetical protein